jgi:hypothetical protein
VRPTLTFDVAPIVGASSISISKAIVLSNATGIGDIVFNAFLLVRGGTSAIANTSGTAELYVPTLDTISILAGQTDTLTAGISRVI